IHPFCRVKGAIAVEIMQERDEILTQQEVIIFRRAVQGHQAAQVARARVVDPDEVLRRAAAKVDDVTCRSATAIYVERFAPTVEQIDLDRVSATAARNLGVAEQRTGTGGHVDEDGIRVAAAGHVDLSSVYVALDGDFRSGRIAAAIRAGDGRRLTGDDRRP